MDEGELIKGCKAFDAAAQKILYEKYASKFYGICFRYLSDEAEAEDAVTEGFLKIFSKINTFEYRGKGSLEGWMKRIVVNESLMLLRKRKHHLVEINQSDEKMKYADSIDSNLIETDILEQIKKLPKGYRTVFNMYAIEGYSHKEIGEKLGISENTSKSQLSKARASLIKSLVHIGAI
ncbi:sigma-70 family RNA polymerase sigma factor [Reichenbachiella agarivorans]|uniref:Sigma-70 family RNA polymerase sigma factor n=1 Tax=Reichenbachiella agarivorans TaxID=2979464 RepID=A0ABY6CLJ4_9BACT|nr:sigma-70 family RNA polymerase sigma factor [Reichenbachiella agarivorans]UXP31382.1 sigma-70 family RNA polymerase sigma factor [Reichenbachiella agarivorans]